MPIFNWNEMLQHLPAEWRSTEGRGVKIAYLDSGAELQHLALRHLDKPGHKFNVARANYAPNAPIPVGNDDISDLKNEGILHGTACLSVLAALPETDDHDNPTAGLKGIAPQAEIYIIKIAGTDNTVTDKNLVDGIHLALKLGVDIIGTSVLTTRSETVTEGRLREVFDMLTASRTVLVTTLRNTDSLARLKRLAFPSTEPESIVAGTISHPILASRPAPADIAELTGLLLPAAQVVCYTGIADTPYSKRECSCSFATACLAGVAALAISRLKEKAATDEIPYERPDRATLLQHLTETVAQPFSIEEMLALPLCFYNPKTALNP
ncbi:MAG: S8/S53 family peptidase [Saprospiraceae bacterium]|nr:S8/S53 family peptidase [Saprospiraceae bacterium]